MIDAFVWWSIAVRCATMNKMKTEHAPPIREAIRPLEPGSKIVIEETGPGVFTLMTVQNLSAVKVEDVVLPVLLRAYRLGNGWRISGLGDLEIGELRHIAGSWSTEKPSPRAPALVSMIFEIEPLKVD